MISVTSLENAQFKLGQMNNDIALFAVTHRRMNVYIFSETYSMTMDLSDNIFHNIFEPFNISDSNFIAISSQSNTAIIKFQPCKV